MATAFFARRPGRIQDRLGIYEGEVVFPKEVQDPDSFNPRSVYNGYGILSAPDGTSVAGWWKSGRCLRGTCISRNGSVFEGDFSGFGTLTTAEGETFRGLWKNGQLVQKGFISSAVGWFGGHTCRMEKYMALRASSKAQDLDVETINVKDLEAGAQTGGAQSVSITFQEPKQKKVFGPPKPLTPWRWYLLSPLTVLATMSWGTYLIAAWEHSYIAFLFHLFLACVILATVGYSLERISRFYRKNGYCFMTNICLFWFSVWAWWYHVVPPIWAEHEMEGKAYIFINFFSSIHYLYVGLCDPGYVPKSGQSTGDEPKSERDDETAALSPSANETDEPRNELEEDDDYAKWCEGCKMRRPLRAKHCNECNACTARFDHHCPAYNNCIGAHNHKHFVLNAFTGIMCTAWYIRWVWLAIGPLWHATQGGFGHKLYVLIQQRPFHATLVYHHGAFFLAGILLWKFNFIYSAFLNLTTNEAVNYRKYRYLVNTWPVPKRPEPKKGAESEIAFCDLRATFKKHPLCPQCDDVYHNAFDRGCFHNFLSWLDVPGYAVDWRKVLHVHSRSSKLQVV